MKKKLSLLLFTILLAACVSQTEHTGITEIRRPSPQPTNYEYTAPIPERGYTPLNYEEQKGMWLSYIDLAPMLSAKYPNEFETRFEEACRNVSELGCNTIYVHVRPFGDAAYESELFPKSDYVCGDYDPLEIMCDVAHEYELSLHAWINPLRLQTADRLSEIEGYPTADWLAEDSDKVCAVEGDEHLWLDPAYPEVRTLIAEGAAEIAENHEVDGIHYDDYFYPTTDEYFDAQCYAEMGCGSSLGEWRMSNISQMCREIYDSVKAVDSRIEVGISPQGNIENNYEYLYADVKTWCAEEGYCDYILPQIYFGYDNSVKPFLSTLNAWHEMCGSGKVRLVVGLAAYKIGSETEFTDNTGIIAKQISDCENCQGIGIYTYNSLFGDNSSDERISDEREAITSALENVNFF